jgi:hypothetical protein
MKKNLADLLEDSKAQVFLFHAILIANLVIALPLVLSPVTSIKGAEPNVIYTIQMTMLNNHWMYQDPESLPFSATQYAPLYYVVCSTVAKIFLLTPGDDVVGIYRISRSVSFLSSLVCAYFIFLILHRVYNTSKRWSYFMAITSILATVPWYYAARPDGLMAALLFASLYFFNRYQKEDIRPFRYLLLSGALATLSFFTKQNGLIICAAIGSYLLFSMRLKELGIFIGGILLGALFCFIVFQPYYSEFVLQHFVQGVNNGIDIQTTIVSVYYSFVTKFGLLIFIVLLLLFVIVFKVGFINIKDEFKFLIYFFGISLLFSTVIALKVGSDTNYFHEVIATALIIMCAGSTILKSIYNEINTRFNRIFVFSLAIALAVTFSLGSILAVGIRNMKRLTERDDVYKKEVLDFVRKEIAKSDTNCYIISEEAFINNAFPLQAVLPHHDIASLWYSRHVYDYHKLREAVSQGKILLCIGNGDKLKTFDIDLERNFNFITNIQGVDIYRTKALVE